MKRKLILIVIILISISFSFYSAKNPVLYNVNDEEIDEASGLAAGIINAKMLYTINDSGGKNRIYCITYKGMKRSEIKLVGIKNRDWEDIAIAKEISSDKSYIYISDTGDNKARYKSVFIYKFLEPIISQKDTLVQIKDIERIEVTYPDSAKDAEALFVDPKTNDIFIISKWEEHVNVYSITYPQKDNEPNRAVKIATLPYTWVVAADISQDGSKLLVKTYSSIYRYKRKDGQSIAEMLNNSYRSLKYIVEPQGESVCWDSRGKSYFTLSERNGKEPLYLYRYYR